MARVTQLLIQAEDHPGVLAQVCSELAAKAVNITAIMAARTDGEGGIRMVATPLAAAKKVLDALGMRYREEEAIALRVTDRPGALGKATRKLGDAGINIRYAYGSIVKGETRALIILGVADVARADALI